MALPENQTPNPTTTTPPSEATPPATSSQATNQSPSETSKDTSEPPKAETPPVVEPPKVEVPPKVEIPPAEVVPPVVEPPKTETPPAEPEGYDLEVAEDSPLSDADLQKIADYAAKNGLKKEEAMDLVASYEAQYKSGLSAAELAQQKVVEQRRQELNSHPEFSGENAQQSWNQVNRAVSVFGTPKIMESLGSEKFGYDVELALMLKEIGKALMSDTTPPPGGNPVNVRDKAKDDYNEKLKRNYPSMFPS
jgi:hypothetical protein